MNVVALKDIQRKNAKTIKAGKVFDTLTEDAVRMIKDGTVREATRQEAMNGGISVAKAAPMQKKPPIPNLKGGEIVE